MRRSPDPSARFEPLMRTEQGNLFQQVRIVNAIIMQAGLMPTSRWKMSAQDAAIAGRAKLAGEHSGRPGKLTRNARVLDRVKLAGAANGLKINVKMERGPA